MSEVEKIDSAEPVAWFWTRGGDLELTILKDGEYGRQLTRGGFIPKPLYLASPPAKEVESRIKALEEALRPFANFADALNEDVPDEISLGIFAGGAMRFGPSGGATLASLRAARAALKNRTPDVTNP